MKVVLKQQSEYPNTLLLPFVEDEFAKQIPSD